MIENVKVDSVAIRGGNIVVETTLTAGGKQIEAGFRFKFGEDPFLDHAIADLTESIKDVIREKFADPERAKLN